MPHIGELQSSLAVLTKTVAAGGGGGGGVADGDKGDITVSGSGTSWTIDAGAVSTSKLGGDITTAGKALLDDADAAAQRATLGLGTAATTASTDYATAAHGHSNATTSVAGYMSATDKTKLDGIASGATANSSDATLLARANHTGTQTASTISDFSEAVDDRVAALLVPGANVTLTYNDAANTLTVAATGGGGGGATFNSTTVDFGSTPVAEATFTVTDAGITATSAIQCFVQADSTVDNDAAAHRAAGRSFRMAATPASGSFSLDVMCLMGLCTGTFKVRYSFV